MNSKERVRAAIQHQQPDRTPADFGCVPETWAKLQQHFGVATPEEVLRRLEVDVRYIDADYIGPELKSYTEGGDRIDESWFGWKSRWHWNGAEYNNIIIDMPLENAQSVEEVLSHRWPDPDWFDYESIKRKCAEHEGKAIAIGHAGVYQFGTFMRSPEKIYLEMAMNPELPRAIFDRFVQFELEYYGRIFEAAGGQIDILRVYDDYGTQSSLLFSVEMWRDFFAENTRRLAELAHKHGAFFMQHSCGQVRSIIPELIACGVDVLDPLQKVPGMEIEGLRADFGGRICFHGGIDTQQLLPFGAPGEVRREAERYVATLGPGGGYILGPSQDFEGDVPVENILAVYGAARD